MVGQVGLLLAQAAETSSMKPLKLIKLNHWHLHRLPASIRWQAYGLLNTYTHRGCWERNERWSEWGYADYLFAPNCKVEWCGVAVWTVQPPTCIHTHRHTTAFIHT